MFGSEAKAHTIKTKVELRGLLAFRRSPRIKEQKNGDCICHASCLVQHAMYKIDQSTTFCPFIQATTAVHFTQQCRSLPTNDYAVVQKVTDRGYTSGPQKSVQDQLNTLNAVEPGAAASTKERWAWLGRAVERGEEG